LDTRRFVIVLVLLALGVAVFTWYVLGKQQERKEAAANGEDGETPAATQPAPQPAPQASAPPAAPDDSAAANGEDDPPASTAPAVAAGDDEPTTATAPATRPAPAAPAAASRWKYISYSQPEDKPIRIGSLAPDSEYVMEVELANRGAAVRSAKLRKYFVTVEDKQLYEENPAAYAEAVRQNPGKYQGHYKALSVIGEQDEIDFPLATRKLVVTIEGETEDATREVPLENEYWYRPAGASENAAVFAFELQRYEGPAGPGGERELVPVVRVEKTYTLDPKDYSLKVTLRVINLLPDRGVKVSLDQLGAVGVPQEARGEDMRRPMAAYYKPESQEVDIRATKDLIKALVEPKKVGVRVPAGETNAEEPALWIGIANKYFASVMYLEPMEGGEAEAQEETDDEGKDELVAREHRAKFFFESTFYTNTRGLYLSGLELPERTIAAGESYDVKLDVYVGPKDRSIFVSRDPLPARPLYDDLGYLDTIELRSCFCAFDSLSWGLMWLLEKLSIVALGNYGVAIILLVVLVRIALHPLTKKGQVSMAKMQKLGPQMKKIKEKYKDDKETLNREMMALYKQAGATPLLGCLPMLLQMPVWLGLWAAINASVSLRHAAFLPVWITDLAAPDALISFGGVNLPLIGAIYGLNLLPLLLAVAMVLQMKMNPQQAAPETDQAKQTRMMMYFMPVMMLFIFYKMPSGLNLYIMASTFAGVAEQYVIRKHIKAREEQQAAVETTVSAPGKKSRSSRPKKPKGPFWIKKG